MSIALRDDDENAERIPLVHNHSHLTVSTSSSSSKSHSSPSTSATSSTDGNEDGESDEYSASDEMTAVDAENQRFLDEKDDGFGEGYGERETDLEHCTSVLVQCISVLTTLFATVSLGWMLWLIFSGGASLSSRPAATTYSAAESNLYLKKPPLEPFARPPKYRASRKERVHVWVDDSGHYSLYDALTDRHNPFEFPVISFSSNDSNPEPGRLLPSAKGWSKSTKNLVNYDPLYSAEGRYSVEDLEFAAMVPPGKKGHVVKMKGKDYTVAMFHQLRCLDIVRRAYVDRVPSGVPRPADYKKRDVGEQSYGTAYDGGYGNSRRQNGAGSGPPQNRADGIELDAHSNAESFTPSSEGHHHHSGSTSSSSSPPSSPPPSSSSKPSSPPTPAEIAERRRELRLKKRLATHCLNYLRQSLLCIADTRVESIRYSSPPHVVSLSGDYVCWDWEKVGMDVERDEE